MTDSILKIENLTKRYKTWTAVNNLSLEVQRGDIYGFLGRNGAGKSTTIRMIMGMVWPTAGKITVCGQPVVTGRHKRDWKVGAIIDSPIFYDYLPGRVNLDMLSSLSGGVEKKRIDDVVELVGLTRRQGDPVSHYSHGMRQRLGLAQALLPRPELLILDEPLDGLDPNGIRDLREVMLRVVREEGITIFVSSHILAEVEMTCNRVAVIHEGQKLYEGSTQDLITTSRKVRLRATRDGGDVGDTLARMPMIDLFKLTPDEAYELTMSHSDVPALNRELVTAGYEIFELSPIKNRLEDVFLDLTEGPGGAQRREEVKAGAAAG